MTTAQHSDPRYGIFGTQRDHCLHACVLERVHVRALHALQARYHIAYNRVTLPVDGWMAQSACATAIGYLWAINVPF